VEEVPVRAVLEVEVEKASSALSLTGQTMQLASCTSLHQSLVRKIKLAAAIK